MNIDRIEIVILGALIHDDSYCRKVLPFIKAQYFSDESEKVIFQKIEDLHASCPNNLGDWYFTGNYPTKGGNKVVNKAFINYMEGRNERGY